MKKLYVVTRSDLPIGDQATQSGHAIAQYFVDHKMKDDVWGSDDDMWLNETLVILTIDDRERLKMLVAKLLSRDIPVYSFEEPDLNDELTAIACYTDGNYFDGLKKLGE